MVVLESFCIAALVFFKEISPRFPALLTGEQGVKKNFANKDNDSGTKTFVVWRKIRNSDRKYWPFPSMINSDTK